jgi:hypothetical protein
VTVGIPPSITSPPISQFVPQGANVSFSASVSGDAPLAFQWTSNSVPLAGQNLSALTFTNVQVYDSATYQIVITNTFGAVTSAPVLLSVATAPTLSQALQISSSGVQLSLQGVAGHVYELQTTRDFVTWTSLGRQTYISSPIIFSDTATNLDYRFYRAVLDP